jgi:hypothetical protein
LSRILLDMWRRLSSAKALCRRCDAETTRLADGMKPV